MTCPRRPALGRGCFKKLNNSFFLLNHSSFIFTVHLRRNQRAKKQFEKKLINDRRLVSKISTGERFKEKKNETFSFRFSKFFFSFLIRPAERPSSLMDGERRRRTFHTYVYKYVLFFFWFLFF